MRCSDKKQHNDDDAETKRNETGEAAVGGTVLYCGILLGAHTAEAGSIFLPLFLMYLYISYYLHHRMSFSFSFRYFQFRLVIYGIVVVYLVLQIKDRTKDVTI